MSCCNQDREGKLRCLKEAKLITPQMTAALFFVECREETAEHQASSNTEPGEKRSSHDCPAPRCEQTARLEGPGEPWGLCRGAGACGPALFF